MSIKEGKLLYHLTSITNIKSILVDGIKPRSSLDTVFKDVAEQEIIDFRNENSISNTIPFHFFAGTPFSGRVQIDNPDEEFVYITVHRDIAKKNNFRIFPTHPLHMNPLRVFEYKEGLEEIDWDLMEQRDYNHEECKETCMAECIAPFKSVPAEVFHSIIVRSDETKAYLEELCKKIYNHQCRRKFFIDVEDWRFVNT